MKGVFVLPAERVSSPPLPPFLLLDTEAAGAFAFRSVPVSLVWIAGIGRAPFLATPTCYLFDVATAYLFVGGRSGSWRQIRRQLEATGDDPKKKSPKWIGQRLQHRRAEGQAVVYVPPDHHPRCQAQDSKSKEDPSANVSQPLQIRSPYARWQRSASRASKHKLWPDYITTLGLGRRRPE
jgi:hypothetical protein